MSMQEWTVNGYGFEVYASDEGLRNFIEKHRETVEKLDQGDEVLEWIDKHPVSSGKPMDSLKEEFYDYTPEDYGEEGLYGLIADVMKKETGLPFEYHHDCENVEAIILPQLYPWQMPDAARDLTKEKLDEIYEKYAADFGGKIEADYLTLEYFG